MGNRRGSHHARALLTVMVALVLDQTADDAVRTSGILSAVVAAAAVVVLVWWLVVVRRRD